MNFRIAKYIFLLLSFFISDEMKNIDNSINNSNKELNEIKNEIENIEKEISKIINEEKEYHKIIEQIDNKIRLTEKLIKTLNDEENYLSNLIYKTEMNIKVKEKELKKMQNQLKNRVRYIYKYGRNNFLSKIVDVQDLNNILYRAKYLEVLNDSEDKIKKRINNSINDLKLEQKALEREKNRKSYLISEKDKEFEQLEKDKKKKKIYINKIKENKEQLRSNLQIKKSAMLEIEKIINKLFSDKKELKKRQEELAKLRAGRNQPTSDNFVKMKQKLPWPVSGNIVGSFGIQTNKKLNTQYENIGIDIQTKENAPVYSVLDGVVLSVTSIIGYGNLVILDHGNGYYTVYSNIKDIAVNENEYISSLYKIGNVAKSNNSHYSSKNIFHFEIWGNNKKLNPEKWLKKKK